MNNGVGVKETSRLISRLRYRQFGIFITTSYISLQAYKEIKQDQHPIIIISGRNIASILIKSGFNSIDMVRAWLSSNFPVNDN
ncbi:restriction endonuclease [Chloroflexota bacterium]